MARKKAAAAAPPKADGRHARAERTRDAIVDALLALLEEGVVKPSAERVAERAGVSRRALFNHFADVEELLGRAAARRLQAITALWPALSQEGSREARLVEVCSRMARFHEQIAPVRRAALAAAAESPVIAAHMREASRMHRGAMEYVFDAELSLLPEKERRATAAGLAAATGFSTWEELRRAQELGVEDALRVMTRLAAGALFSEKEPARKK